MAQIREITVRLQLEIPNLSRSEFREFREARNALVSKILSERHQALGIILPSVVEMPKWQIQAEISRLTAIHVRWLAARSLGVSEERLTNSLANGSFVEDYLAGNFNREQEEFQAGSNITSAINDTTCKFYVDSKYLDCTANPKGSCDMCKDYQSSLK
jgi:hypothetical protein